MGLIFMKFGNLDSYKVLTTHLLFADLLAIFEILSDSLQFWFLVFLKFYP